MSSVEKTSNSTYMFTLTWFNSTQADINEVERLTVFQINTNKQNRNMVTHILYILIK